MPAVRAVCPAASLGYWSRAMDSRPPAGSSDWLPRWLPPLAIVALATPTLLLGYLPMTDLPQHLAVTSMLKHLDDPRFGFSEYYELAPWRTLYLLPYGLVLALAKLLPLEIAMRIAVFLSVVAYPLGVMALLRATGRSHALALLALPLMYNRAFFWGFINFNLALGLSFFAMALLERRVRSLPSKLALAALCTAIPLTHVYGIPLVLGYAAVALALRRDRALRSWALPLAPLGIGAVAWFALGRHAVGRGALYFDSLRERLLGFEDATLGGYPDPSDELLLAAMLLAIAFFARPAFSRRSGGLRGAAPALRTAALLAAANLALYFTLPTHTETALFVHFRHGLLAVCFLPLLASDRARVERPRVSCAVLAALAGATFLIHGSHLLRFDREARPFDAVVEQLPDHPKLYFLSWDRAGAVVQTNPYHHFHAYIQARRGGVIAFSFPEMFWNIPVRLRADAGVPPLPRAAEWRPWTFDDDAVGGFYDFVLVRNRRDGSGGVGTLPRFRYERIYADPPWELYRRVDARD